MWFRSKPAPNSIDQDFITRYWDLSGRVESLEAHVDDRLHELEKRYKRSEQAERSLAKKKEGPCADDNGNPGTHRIIQALRNSQKRTV